jgi:hypothetical protein
MPLVLLVHKSVDPLACFVHAVGKLGWQIIPVFHRVESILNTTSHPIPFSLRSIIVTMVLHLCCMLSVMLIAPLNLLSLLATPGL